MRASQAELAKAREKEKEYHMKDKAVQHFLALLADMVSCYVVSFYFKIDINV